MNFIVAELFELQKLLKDQTSTDRDLLIMKGNAIRRSCRSDQSCLRRQVMELNNPALSLVLASSSRAFLRYNCRGLRGISNAAYNAPYSNQPARNLQTIFEQSSISVMQFERILAEIDSGIKKAYLAAGVGETNRQVIEKEMLIAADVPEILVGVVHHLLHITLESLSHEVDLGELYFRDHSWLGLTDDRRSDAFRQNSVIDAIRKIVLGEHVRVRRCTRCCAIMEDLLPQRGGNLWMTNMQRMCLCGSSWMLISQGY